MRLNNYSESRISFEGRHRNLSTKGSQLLSHQFHPKEINGEIDESTEVTNARNSKSINKIQVSHYYHNAKALENVLKDDKDLVQKREFNRQQIIQRKEKVASYSKLVREIHWDNKNNEQRKDSHDVHNHRKMPKRDSNMTFEQRAESNQMRTDRVRQNNQRSTKEHKSVIETNDVKENFDFNIKSNIKTSKNKDLRNESKNIYNLKRNIENAINKHHALNEEHERTHPNVDRGTYCLLNILGQQEHQIAKISQKNQKQFRVQEHKRPNKSIREIRDSPNTMIKPFELEDSVSNIEGKLRDLSL